MSNFDSNFGPSVTDKKIFQILKNSEFKFEEYLQRDGPWSRYSRCGKTMYIVLTITTCFIMLLYIPLFIYIFHMMDKVLSPFLLDEMF